MDDLVPLLVERLTAGGEVTLIVTGNSMYPLLRHQIDSVSLLCAPSGRLRRDEIALYRRQDGSYILHRIVAIREGHYLAVGDGQWQCEMVEPDQVVGVVRGIWRSGRFIACSHPLYRVYTFLWTRLMPIRRCLLRAILMLFR